MPPLSRVVNRRNRQRRGLLSHKAVIAGTTAVVVFLTLLGLIQENNNTGLGLGSYLLSQTGDMRLAEDETKEKRNNAYERIANRASKRMRVTKDVNKQLKRPVVLPSDFEGLKLLSKDDPIYQWGSWDESPIVVESHKLLFFTIPKVGCTVFKQLFRRMYGYQTWKEHNDFIPHHPMSNGLNYLYHYTPQKAEQMLTDPSWTRAIFFRDPKERLLSAYLDKVLHDHGKYVRVHCCGNNPTLKSLLHCQVPVEKLPNPLLTFSDFLEKIIPQCTDPHWRAQAHRLPDSYWFYINFVGHMDRIEQDTRRMLQKIGAWDDFGAQGWESGAIFAGAASVAHATDARRKVSSYYKSAQLIQLAERLHKVDYEHPVVSMSKT